MPRTNGYSHDVANDELLLRSLFADRPVPDLDIGTSSQAYAAFTYVVTAVIYRRQISRLPEANDVAHNVYIRIREKRLLTRFDPRRSLRRYVMGVTIKMLLEMDRKARPAESLRGEPADTKLATPYAQVARRELLHNIMAAFSLLSEAQCRALIRKHGCPCCKGPGDGKSVQNEFVQRHRGHRSLRAALPVGSDH